MEPTVRIDRLTRRVGLVVIPFHDVRAAGEYLPVQSNLYLDPVDRLADGADAEIPGSVHRDHRRCLGESVSFEDDEAGCVEELVDLGRERRTAGYEVAQASTSARLELGENQLLRDRILLCQQAGRLSAGELLVRPSLGDAARPEENLLLQESSSESCLENARVHLLVETRHRQHNRRFHFLQIYRNGVD